MAITSVKTSGTPLTVDDIEFWGNPLNIIKCNGWVYEKSAYGVRGPIINYLMSLPQIPTLITSGEEVVGDWTEELSGKFDVTVGANNVYYTSTNTTRFTVTSSTAVTNYYISNNSIDKGKIPVVDGKNQMDWTFDQYLGFWGTAASGAYDGDGELKFSIKNNGSWGTAVNVPAFSSAYRVWKQIDITSFARDRVEGIKFISNSSDTTSETLDISFLVRYMLGGQGPVWGARYLLYPGKEGTILSQGYLANYEVGYIDAGASGDTGIVGVVVIGNVGDVSECANVLIANGGITPLETGGAITAGMLVMMGSAPNEVVTSAGVGDGDESVGKALEASSGDGAFVMVDLGKDGAAHLT